MVTPYVTEQNVNDFSDAPEFEQWELVAMLRTASKRYAEAFWAGDVSGRANAALEMHRIEELLHIDYTTR